MGKISTAQLIASSLGREAHLAGAGINNYLSNVGRFIKRNFFEREGTYVAQTCYHLYDGVFAIVELVDFHSNNSSDSGSATVIDLSGDEGNVLKVSKDIIGLEKMFG